MDKFTIEYQWQFFLGLCKITKKQMHPIQYNEMKKAFYGASGQILLLLRDEIAELSDDDAYEKLEDMAHEIDIFWKSQLLK